MMKIDMLYRFHPFRGHHEIDRDLASIDVTRGNPRELALRSLNKWRRIHSRAKLDDLNQALRVVGRGDPTRENSINPLQQKHTKMKLT